MKISRFSLEERKKFVNDYFNSGLTQKEFSKKVGISPKTVWSWIRQYAPDKITPKKVSGNKCGTYMGSINLDDQDHYLSKLSKEQRKSIVDEILNGNKTFRGYARELQVDERTLRNWADKFYPDREKNQKLQRFKEDYLRDEETDKQPSPKENTPMTMTMITGTPKQIEEMLKKMREL